MHRLWNNVFEKGFPKALDLDAVGGGGSDAFGKKLLKAPKVE